MQKLKIDIEEIGMAMNEGNLEITYYLNLETGELTCYNRFFDELDEDEYEEIEFNGSYELVPRLDASEKFKMRTIFASTRKSVLRNALLVALKQKRGLTQFRKVLDKNPNDLEEWYNFEQEFLSDKTKEWLNKLEIEPE